MRKLTTADYALKFENPFDEAVLLKVLNGCHNRQAWRDEYDSCIVDAKVARARYDALCEAASAVAPPRDELQSFFESDEQQFAGSPILPLITAEYERVRQADYWVRVLEAVGENQDHFDRR